MAEQIVVDRQTMLNLYRVANNTAKQLELLMRRFDLTDDTEERKESIAIIVHSSLSR